MRACQCPNCNANLEFDETLQFGFCQFCGTKIMMDDYRSTQHIVDEAKIKEAEVRKLELEIEEKKRADNKKLAARIGIVAAVFLVIGGFLVAFFGENDSSIGMFGFIIFGLAFFAGCMAFCLAMGKSTNNDFQIKSNYVNGTNAQAGIIIPAEMFGTLTVGNNYQTAEANLLGLGFTNVKLVNLHDLSFFSKSQDGRIESVTINGRKVGFIVVNQVYAQNAPIVITYHGLK